jgi:hypothetical protein
MVKRWVSLQSEECRREIELLERRHRWSVSFQPGNAQIYT